MALFLSLGFPFFALFLSLSLCTWRYPLSYFLSFLLGVGCFGVSWGALYLLKVSYQGFSDFSPFGHNTLIFFFSNTFLLSYLPLLLFSTLLFSWYSQSQNSPNLNSRLYFWFSGFFSGFSLYITLQASSRYSSFEYLFLPFLLTGFFLTTAYVLLTLRNLPLWTNMFGAFSVSLSFSLPTIFFKGLYFRTFWIITGLCFLFTISSLYFLFKHKERGDFQESISRE